MKDIKLNHPHILKIHKVSFLTSKSINKVLDEFLHIGFSQSMILMYIHKHPKVSQREISSNRNITPAAVSRHIEMLIQKDFIKQKENELNKREHILEISEKGEEILTDVVDTINNHLENLFNDLDDEEIKTLDRIFTKLLGSFDDSANC